MASSNWKDRLANLRQSDGLHEKGVEARIRKLRAIRKRCRGLLKDGPSAVEHGDFLYDENGLPN